MKEKVLHSVYEEDLEKLLTNLGLLDKVKSGEYRCEFCDKKITIQNLQCVFPKEGTIRFCCEEGECFEAALAQFKEEE